MRVSVSGSEACGSNAFEPLSYRDGKGDLSNAKESRYFSVT